MRHENTKSLLRWQTILLLLVIMVGLNGCVSRSVTMRFNAASQMNPDASQQSLPVQVKVFQLKDDLAFRNADFDDLWQQGQQALGDSYLAESDFMILPDSEKSLSIDMNSKAKYLGFVAVFRTRRGYTWRAIEKVPNAYFIYPKFNVSLKGNSIHVTQAVF